MRRTRTSHAVAEHHRPLSAAGMAIGQQCTAPTPGWRRQDPDHDHRPSGLVTPHPRGRHGAGWRRLWAAQEDADKPCGLASSNPDLPSGVLPQEEPVAANWSWQDGISSGDASGSTTSGATMPTCDSNSSFCGLPPTCRGRPQTASRRWLVTGRWRHEQPSAASVPARG